jgi:beta-hydroxyacyl-ACP dehydratase FabZ
MGQLENIDIRDILPHRFPMLLVDRIVEIGPDSIVGIKNVTANEPFFQGHFPEYPVMPGVLIIEAMAQVGGILVLKELEDRKTKLVLFAAIEEAKFRRQVLPGDVLRMELKTLKRKATIVKMKGTALVDGQVVAEAVVLCKVVDLPAKGEATQG